MSKTNLPTESVSPASITSHSKGLLQNELAGRAGITRRAVSAIESNLYLPTTGAALRLASIFGCRGEDLLSLQETNDFVEGDLIGQVPLRETLPLPIRVKVAIIGKRTIVRLVSDLGEQLSFTVLADGYMTDTNNQLLCTKVRVKLLP